MEKLSTVVLVFLLTFALWHASIDTAASTDVAGVALGDNSIIEPIRQD